MLSSIRISAGVLALAALSLALAEGVVAATCAPAAVGSPVVGEASHEMPGGLEWAPRHVSQDHDHDSPCPFAPLGSPDGCVGAASLPSVTMSELALPPAVFERRSSSRERTELLMAAALFRPPRA